ncbi:hypothetical protein [Ascidiimonas aurantiaca]|uniref:hypothetical protein n=1 Tax=Ascidiimonas aurantiaca TaxID=1685432 RepID=UPI0030EF6A9D
MKKVDLKLKELALRKSTVASFNVEEIKGGNFVSRWRTCTCSDSICPPGVQCY